MKAIAAELVREVRERGALTQAALAERADTAQSVVARIETGQSQPNLETLQRLVAAAGFSLALELKPAPAADPVVQAYKSDVDRSLLRESLSRTADRRVRALEQLAGLAHEARAAGQRRGR